MQTAKITVGGQYAYKNEYDNNTLYRFKVDAIVTTKGLRGTVSEIEGCLINADGTAQPQRKVKPEDLLGPYEEQATLKAQADAIAAARREADKARVDASKRCAELLRRLAGVPFVTVQNGFRKGEDDSTIRPSYRGVEISVEGVEALLKVLDRRPDLKVVNDE